MIDRPTSSLTTGTSALGMTREPESAGATSLRRCPGYTSEAVRGSNKLAGAAAPRGSCKLYVIVGARSDNFVFNYADRIQPSESLNDTTSADKNQSAAPSE